MGVPKICEWLGVEPFQQFKIRGYDGVFMIQRDGTFVMDKGDGKGASVVLLQAIDQPWVVTKFNPVVLTEDEYAILASLNATSFEWGPSDCRLHVRGEAYGHEELVSAIPIEYFPSLADQKFGCHTMDEVEFA